LEAESAAAAPPVATLGVASGTFDPISDAISRAAGVSPSIVKM
jgi:hypothetical protein